MSTIVCVWCAVCRVVALVRAVPCECARLEYILSERGSETPVSGPCCAYNKGARCCSAHFFKGLWGGSGSCLPLGSDWWSAGVTASGSSRAPRCGGGPVERRIPADAFYGAQQHQHAADVHFGIAGAAVRGRAVRVRV